MGNEPQTRFLVYCQEDFVDLFRDLKLEGRLKAQVHFVSVDRDSFSLRICLEGSQNLLCVRTLEPFTRNFRVDFRVEIQKVSGLATVAFDDSDDDVYCISVPQAQNWVDISECVRQQVILQEPMNPVANPEAEFVWTDKAVAEQSEDPAQSPWAKLQEWKERNSITDQE